VKKLIRGSIVTAAIAGTLALPAVASAAANLLPNGSFDGGTTAGWKGTNATLKTVSPGFGGTADAAQVSLSNAATAYTMFASPRPVASAAAGQQYQGTASVLGITGRSVCLLLQEYTGSTLAQTAKQCITANGSWQSLIVTLTAKADGDSIAYLLRQTGAKAGDSFQADSLELVNSTSPPPPPPPGTVVALWHMDEPAGATTMADSSGFGNNGTLNGPVTTGVPGFQGNAYSFSGHSYVDVPTSDSLNPGTANVGISFYMNTTHLPTSGDYDLVRKGVYPQQQYKIELLKTNQIACSFTGSSGSSNATGGANLADGTWHHIECIKTPTTIQLLIDGVLVKTTSVIIGSISTTGDASLGAHPGYDWYQGMLDEVSIAIG
jgi:concanavalin A-like lectin/glucanase superfamily protein